MALTVWSSIPAR